MRYAIPVLLILTSFAYSTGPLPAVAAAETRGNLISRVVARRTTIEIRAGAKEPLYSVETASGAVLARDMTLKQLTKKNNEAYHAVMNMQDQVLWAGE